MDKLPNIHYMPRLYSDDARTIVELLSENWSLGPQNEANISYIPEQMFTSARIGNIYVYMVSRSNRPASTDYNSLDRTSNLSIKVSTRFREDHFDWCEEVYRILMDHRRCTTALGGYLMLEVTGDRPTRDLSGWYTTTIDVKLTIHNMGTESSGFGDTA